MRPLRPLSLVFVLAAVVVAIGGSSRPAGAAEPNVSSITGAPVTVYAAKWCSACRSLERGLTDRKIAFEVIDVDDNPSAFARAKSASNTSGAIPLTGIAKSSGTVWIVGSDVEGVDRAQRGD